MFLWPILAITLCFGVACAAAATRPYTIEHYDAKLILDFDKRRVEGTETIRVRALAGSTREIELDADEIVVDSVRLGTRSQTFSQPVDSAAGRGHLVMRLSEALPLGKKINLTMTLHGWPTKGLVFAGKQAYTVYNTSHWLVVNHDPKDLATLRLSLMVPRGMVVIGNGVNIGSKEVGPSLVSVWNEKRAIPDFVFGFAVGPFMESKTIWGKTELRCFSAEYSVNQMSQIFRATAGAVDFFSRKAGVPYPGRRYSQIMVNGNPEQELGDFTLLPDSYGATVLAHPEDEWLLAHELAHQWWGIGLACRDWSDFWLNEGVATFMADVFLGERYGAARYEHEIEMAHQIYERLKAAGKDHPLCYRGRAENEVGGRLPYDKGAWVLHLLKQQLGDDVFWRGFENYTRAHWGRTVNSKDFQRSMEKAAGSSLDAFFDQWVYR